MDLSQGWKPIGVDRERDACSHREPGEEFLFYRSVAAGLIDAVQDNCSRGAFENLEGAGRLSENPVTNLRYHFVVTAAMLTRFCMEGGMPMEEAFSLSDEYIRSTSASGRRGARISPPRKRSRRVLALRLLLMTDRIINLLPPCVWVRRGILRDIQWE